GRLAVARLQAHERIAQAGDGRRATSLDVRIACERRKLLPVDRDIDIDHHDVAGLRGSVDGLKLRVRLAHRLDGLVDLFGARRRARTEPRDLRLLVVALEDAVGLTRKPLGVDLHLERDLRSRVAANGVTERACGGRGGGESVGHGTDIVYCGCTSSRYTRATK